MLLTQSSSGDVVDSQSSSGDVVCVFMSSLRRHARFSVCAKGKRWSLPFIHTEISRDAPK